MFQLLCPRLSEKDLIAIFSKLGTYFNQKNPILMEKMPFSTILVQKITLNHIFGSKFSLYQILYIGFMVKTSLRDNNTNKHADFWTK